ncbi:MAG: PAS domain S-box protein [Sedimentisphaerales bacterium]
MRISIRLKILIFFTAILVATSTVNLFFIGQILKKDYKSALYSELLVLGNNLQGQLKRITSLGVSTKDIEGFDQQCLELVKKNNNIAQAMIIDEQGTIVFHNDPSRQGKKLIHKDIFDSIAEGRTGIYSIKENNENLYFAVFPFEDIPNRFEYAIVIVSPAKIINDKILSLINKCNVVLLSTFGLAAILLLTGLTTMLTAPLTVILNTMRDITKTRNLQKRVDIRTHDEIGQIADAFNQMTNDLQHSTTSVENLNSEIAERKNAESKLQLTQFSIDNSPDCAFRVRENGEFVYVNKAACDALGYSKDELLSMKVCDIDPDMPMEKWPQHWQEVKEKGFVVFESHHKTKNGTVFPVEMSIYFVNFEGQEYICAFARDISERKKVERERLEFINRIRQQENAIVRISTNDALSLGDVREAMQVITEVTADTLKVERAGIWLFSKDGEKLECIDLFERSAAKHSDGVSLDVDKYPRYLTALEFGRAIDASDARMDTRVSELVEEYLMPLDVMSMLDTPIRISGEIVGVVCNESVGEKRVWTADEITFAGEIADQAAQTLINADRKKVENELRSSETRFRQIVSNASEWIWEVDTNGLYTYSSPVVKDLLGYKPEEIVGKKHFYDLFTADSRDELKKMAFETFATKQAFKGSQNTNIHKDGRIVWLLTSGVPILDSNGNLVGYRGSDIDITERKEIEQKLKQLEFEMSDNKND